jgi:hypothetical protein
MDDLTPLLGASRAHPEFKAAVEAYASLGSAPRVVTNGRVPRVKIVRVIAQLLDTEPDLAIESVAVRGSSGCCDFRGEVTVAADGRERTWEFVWDCRWRAREAGYVDLMGWPDQTRAAREFGWRCFSTWAEHGRPRPSPFEQGTQGRPVEPCA